VAVVGGGPTGMAAAWDLQRYGCTVTLFEAATAWGGLASGFRAAHWTWSLEKYYHHWFASDRHILGLIRELGLAEGVVFRRPYTVVYHGGRFHPLDSPWHALRFTASHFSALDVLRFGLVGAYLRLSPWWRPLERVTADRWMRRWVGPRLYEAVWRPLLVGKFGEENLGVVNMAWLWSRIHNRTTRLGTFFGGFQAFFDAFAERLAAAGCTLRPGCPVERIAPRDASRPGELEVRSAAGSETFDAVLFTGSPQALLALAPQLPDHYARSVAELRSLGAVVLILALAAPLTTAYWHNLPKEAGFPFLALVEHTNFVPAEHFGGDHLVYCGDYLPPSHPYFALDKEALLARFLPALPRFNPAFDATWVKDAFLWRTAYAQPVPPVNHGRRIPPLRTPLPGLYLASMSQVYPHDRGTNYAVELGRRVARLLRDDLAARHRLPTAGRP